jgi:hypothetical protein
MFIDLDGEDESEVFDLCIGVCCEQADGAEDAVEEGRNGGAGRRTVWESRDRQSRGCL